MLNIQIFSTTTLTFHLYLYITGLLLLLSSLQVFPLPSKLSYIYLICIQSVIASLYFNISTIIPSRRSRPNTFPYIKFPIIFTMSPLLISLCSQSSSTLFYSYTCQYCFSFILHIYYILSILNPYLFFSLSLHSFTIILHIILFSVPFWSSFFLCFQPIWPFFS